MISVYLCRYRYRCDVDSATNLKGGWTPAESVSSGSCCRPDRKAGRGGIHEPIRDEWD